MTRTFKPNARQRRALGPVLSDSIPTHADVNRSAEALSDIAKMRAAFTRFETRHGADALISFLKTELEARGEKRWRLDALAPKPGHQGQTSILDAGR